MYSTVLSMAARKEVIEVGMVRHIALDIIRSIKTKFKNEFGDLVIASDSTSYWRKEYFPFYKAKRKQKRDESGLDWKNIFNCINEVKGELREFMPYKYVEVEGAEADDVIAVLVQNYHHEGPIIIISGDKDYLNLQKYPNVKQYDPVKKRFNKTDNPELTLREHIVRGDSNDGIPNILSADNSLAMNIRQKRITEKVLDQFLNTDFFETIDEDKNNPHYRNYKRNKTLIDLTQIPQEITSKIMECYEASKPTRKNLRQYFMSKRLRHHLEQLNQF